MAIARDNFTTPQTVTSTLLPFSLSVSGSDRILFVFGHDTTGASSTVTGVKATKGGTLTAMIPGPIVRNPATGRWITGWYMIAPDTGTNNIEVSSSTSQNLRFSAVSYTGVDQSSPIINTSSFADASSTTTISNTIDTTGTDNCWMIMFSKDENGGFTWSSTTGDTMVYASDPGGHAISETGAISPGASNTMTHSNGGTPSTNFKAISFAFKPVAAITASPYSPNLLLMGVG